MAVARDSIVARSKSPDGLSTIETPSCNSWGKILCGVTREKSSFRAESTGIRWKGFQVVPNFISHSAMLEASVRESAFGNLNALGQRLALPVFGIDLGERFKVGID